MTNGVDAIIAVATCRTTAKELNGAVYDGCRGVDGLT